MIPPFHATGIPHVGQLCPFRRGVMQLPPPGMSPQSSPEEQGAVAEQGSLSPIGALGAADPQATQSKNAARNGRIAGSLFDPTRPVQPLHHRIFHHIAASQFVRIPAHGSSEDADLRVTMTWRWPFDGTARGLNG